MSSTDDFASGSATWLSRLDNLRNVVRQEMVARQLQRHLSPTARVLDVGAGQGTQARRLAEHGHTVTCIEPDPDMRKAFQTALATAPADVGRRIELYAGALGDLDGALGERTFDAVLCHGVLMYLPEPESAVRELATFVAAGGILSLVARNRDAMAWRPALRGQWPAALAALDELDAARAQDRDARYRNEIGVDARADDHEHLIALCHAAGLSDVQWYGVRVASDGVPVDEPVPEDPATLEALLAVEERLGERDPYRRLGTLVHVLARRR
ncbi:methyltransferase domain-containing protein [Luteipulveratus mongoliensis]|uniref:Methyltransferase type 11 domain-containing protein n=1 Tax=Luteipulveratus mongoliensis TaxID=571913 RepID=A0A0K1JK45_9MICO|nr:methyltransferase domain-containing protein [Luteipulveratus mongoliensis]AKU16945.1 hypothetical protein VV02_15570 [Luteipulveratus mongoliensis]